MEKRAAAGAAAGVAAGVAAGALRGSAKRGAEALSEGAEVAAVPARGTPNDADPAPLATGIVTERGDRCR